LPLTQQLTFPLLAVAIVANNPLYLIHAYFPQAFFCRVDLVATPVFHGLLYFTVLVLLDSVVRGDGRLTLLRSTPSLALAVAKGAVEFLIRWRLFAVAPPAAARRRRNRVAARRRGLGRRRGFRVRGAVLRARRDQRVV
jgi:hypothetical protein